MSAKKALTSWPERAPHLASVSDWLYAKKPFLKHYPLKMSDEEKARIAKSDVHWGAAADQDRKNDDREKAN